MNKYQVDVIDGTISADEIQPVPDPDFATKPELNDVMQELMAREPLFHRAEFGRTRTDFETMTTSDFWKVGASGKRYSCEVVIDSLEKNIRTRPAKPGL